MPSPRTPGSVRAGLILAVLGAGALAATGGMLFLLTMGFADDGQAGAAAAAGAALVAPNFVLANLLVAGGVRLHSGHRDGRWWLTIAAGLDLVTAVVWSGYLRDDSETFTRALVYLLGPALLAAILVWTPSARRWTHPDRAMSM